MPLPTPSPSSTCLVTGASSGIGAAFARQLATLGHNVFLVARREDRLRELAAEIERDHGVQAGYWTGDLAEAASWDTLRSVVSERGLDVAVLVNNAGMSTVGDVHENPDRQIGMIRLNCEALVALTTTFLPAMVENGRGTIINVASVAAFQPIPAQTVYAATKSFVLSFTEGISAELRGTGVTATAVCPGPVATEFIEAAGFKRSIDEMPSFVSWSTPEDVAQAGIEAADKGRRVVVHGLSNRVMASLGHFAPQAFVLGPMSRIYRRSIGE